MGMTLDVCKSMKMKTVYLYIYITHEKKKKGKQILKMTEYPTVANSNTRKENIIKRV